MSQIGKPVREIEFEPMQVPDTVPDDLPATPAPQPNAPAPEREPVPA